MLDENSNVGWPSFLRLHTIVQHFITFEVHSFMEDKTSLVVVVLNELMDFDDEKPCRGKTRQWVKRRRESGYFTNIIQELKVGDRMGFEELFRMDVVDFEYVLSQISDLISSQEINGGHSPVLCDERLALTLRYFATGESFQSLSFQFRISLNAVSYIVKGCCDAVVERMVPLFVKSHHRKKNGLKFLKKLKHDGTSHML